MLTLHGTLRGVLRNPARTLNDGRQIDAYDQVQLEVEEVTDSGQTRVDVVTLTVTSLRPYEGLTGHSLALPVRAYGRRSGGIGYVVTGDPLDGSTARKTAA